MFIGASLFMWALRAWKIGQMEIAAATQNKPIRDVDATQAGGMDGLISATPSTPPSTFVRRLFVWKKV